ncbi:DUF397 domain-containing protein [Streptomyces sp. NPDC086082]|uniref:DUF397 domain-containing protein n=1 Tax=Streptomyces sp. NPDC086082 TaxID=3365750 RepID=UPI0037FA5A33
MPIANQWRKSSYCGDEGSNRVEIAELLCPGGADPHSRPRRVHELRRLGCYDCWLTSK